LTPAQFKKLALAIPHAEEGQHVGHPDFRIYGKIFATLQPAKGVAMVKISVEQQAVLVERDPETFLLFGGWSKNGATGIALARAKAPLVRDLLKEAASRVPKKKGSA
jgi:hypothetical protein